jgi:hypothetical protein
MNTVLFFYDKQGISLRKQAKVENECSVKKLF